MVSGARASWAAFAAVMLLAAGLLFWDLGAGEWRTWDEGLYARLSRNALEHSTYLYAVDEAGEPFKRFSKPPMTLWLSAMSMSTFGISVASLRLPFALGMFATIGFAFGWGKRIGGLPMAISWSLGLALCAATTRWGRHACIEPLFMAGLIGGLWAYHAAVDAPDAKQRTRAAVLAGLAFSFAFMTKQLAVGMALVPIVGLELWRRERASLSRLALALGLPAIVGVTWFLLAGAATDGSVYYVLLERGVAKRMAGFAHGQNARTLNELSGVVDDAGSPIPWALGAAGLALLCVMRPRAELRKPSAEFLLPLWFASNLLVLDTVSQSMLPWYALHIIVPAVGGAAWLVAATALRAGRSPLHMARAALGWVTVGVVALAAAQSLASQFNVALVGGVLLVGAYVRRPEMTRATALLGVALLMFGARMRDRELNPPDQPFAPLMKALADHPRVAVDRRAGLAELAFRGLYGPHAVEVKRAPWPTTDYDAYLLPLVPPVEYEPPEGITLHRAPGAVAFVGDLTQPAWSHEILTALLDAGPITFEAEHLAATGWATTFDDANASGGALRRYTLYRNEKPPKIPLSIGPKIRLPRGRYTLDLWMRWSCPEGSGERTAAATTGSTDARELFREKLLCSDAPDELSPVRFEFELRTTETINMRVGFRYGTVEHDRSVLTRLPDEPAP
jgi:MYXO-CTERM domain-containing protein